MWYNESETRSFYLSNIYKLPSFITCEFYAVLFVDVPTRVKKNSFVTIRDTWRGMDRNQTVVGKYASVWKRK